MTDLKTATGVAGWVLRGFKLLKSALPDPGTSPFSVVPDASPAHLDEGTQTVDGVARPLSVLRASVIVTNVSKEPAVVTSVRAALRFVDPLKWLVWSDFEVPVVEGRRGSGGSMGAVQLPPHASVTVSALMYKFDFPVARKRMYARIEVVDHRDRASRSRWFPVSANLLQDRVRAASERADEAARLRRHTQDIANRLNEAGHSREAVEVVVSALRTEAHAYASHGRSAGGLGSVSFTYRGRTYYGTPAQWQTVGTPGTLVPQDPETCTIASANGDTLVETCARHYGADEARFSVLLFAFLDRESEFSDVGYLIVLAAHRLGLLGRACEVAADRLQGAPRFGFSEVIRMLSGLISFAYHEISVEDLREVETLFANLPDEGFQIPARIAEARVMKSRRQ